MCGRWRCAASCSGPSTPHRIVPTPSQLEPTYMVPKSLLYLSFQIAFSPGFIPHMFSHAHTNFPARHVANSGSTDFVPRITTEEHDQVAHDNVASSMHPLTTALHSLTSVSGEPLSDGVKTMRAGQSRPEGKLSHQLMTNTSDPTGWTT